MLNLEYLIVYMLLTACILSGEEIAKNNNTNTIETIESYSESNNIRSEDANNSNYTESSSNYSTVRNASIYLDNEIVDTSNLTVKNETVNVTLNEKLPIWDCKPFNITGVDKDENVSTVILRNETVISNVFDEMNKTQGCALVLFYSPYCHFCASISPLYNAVGRSYTDIAVIAIDAQEAMSMAARYGVFGIPTVFFFYNGKAVAKFNRSRTPGNVEGFVKRLSGFRSTTRIEILEMDKIGPLSSIALETTDYYMMFSITFLSLFIIGHLFGGYFKRFIQYLGTSVNTLFQGHAKVE